LTQATNQLTRTTAVRINEIFCDIFYLNWNSYWHRINVIN
jgi:hypothetical protein